MFSVFWLRHVICGCFYWIFRWKVDYYQNPITFFQLHKMYWRLVIVELWWTSEKQVCSPLAALRRWAGPLGCRCRLNRPCRSSSCSGCFQGGELLTAGRRSWQRGKALIVKTFTWCWKTELLSRWMCLELWQSVTFVLLDGLFLSTCFQKGWDAVKN